MAKLIRAALTDEKLLEIIQESMIARRTDEHGPHPYYESLRDGVVKAVLE